jgi:hypothetical protein
VNSRVETVQSSLQEGIIMKRFKLKRLAGAALALGLGATTVQAAEFGNITINGYGHQSFLRATHNEFLGADRSGSFSDNTFALVLTAKLDDKSKVWSQIASISGSSLDVHWFYVDRVLSDQLTVRAGKVLAPLGFYNEYIDARYLQQSTILPSLYQPDTDLVDEAYGGAGLTWTQPVGNGRMDFDLYGGQIVEHSSVAGQQKQKGLVGGRIDWHTPIDGLRLMASAATKTQLTLGDPADTRKTSAILSAGWSQNRLDLKSEYGWIQRSMGGRTDSTHVWYVQAGYELTESWRPFVRYERLRAPGYTSDNPATFQNTLALGVTYRFNSYVGLRLENHFNRGYAQPVLSGETAAGTGVKDWQMFGASVVFMF